MFVILFYIENRCDSHQYRVHNASIPAEQTYVGMFYLFFFLLLKEVYFYLIIAMIRTMLSFSAIHILLVIITFICGLYSIREYRYTYKRLTGMIYVVTGK
jgi:hypothetical protein